MTDVRLRETITLDEGPTLDWFIRETNILDEREELASSVRVALGTDALARKDEILPDPDSTDRRGWWGDMDAAEIWGGWPIGTKNWLLTRAKITDAVSSEGSTVGRAERYTLDALQPFVDNKIASSISVSAERTDVQTIEVHATIFRGPESEIDLRFQVLWEEDAAVEPDPKAGVDVLIRVPFRDLTVTTIKPTIPLYIPSGNLALSAAGPQIPSQPPILKETIRGFVTITTTAPVRTP